MRRSGRRPFFLGLVNTVLHGLLQGSAEQVASGIEGVGFAGVEDVAVGGSLGEGVHLGNKSNGAFDGAPFRFAAILESDHRHETTSWHEGRLARLIADLPAYFQWHTPAREVPVSVCFQGISGLLAQAL